MIVLKHLCSLELVQPVLKISTSQTYRLTPAAEARRSLMSRELLCFENTTYIFIKKNLSRYQIYIKLEFHLHSSTRNAYF